MGLAFGTIQMVLYAVYRNHKPAQDQTKLPEHKGDIENFVVATLTTVDEKPPQVHNIEVLEKKENEIQDQIESNNNNGNKNNDDDNNVNNKKTGEGCIEVKSLEV